MNTFYHEMSGATYATPLAPFQECRAGSISTVNSLLEPIQNLFLNPSHPVGAELNPLREFACRLEASDVLRRVKNKLLELPFR